jgi:hypothetical protein
MNNFDKKKFLQIIRKYKSILDYGCGYGIFTISKKINYLYDPDKKLFSILKKKYKKNNFFKVLKKPKFNNVEVLFMNSVFQYLTPLQVKIIKRKMRNFKIIIISDIPKYPRIIEALFLLLINPRRLVLGIKNFLYKKEPYTKLQFSYYSTKEIKKKFLDFKIKIITNLDNEKFTRYTVILKNKKYLKNQL